MLHAPLIIYIHRYKLYTCSRKLLVFIGVYNKLRLELRFLAT